MNITVSITDIIALIALILAVYAAVMATLAVARLNRRSAQSNTDRLSGQGLSNMPSSSHTLPHTFEQQEANGQKEIATQSYSNMVTFPTSASMSSTGYLT